MAEINEIPLLTNEVECGRVKIDYLKTMEEAKPAVAGILFWIMIQNKPYALFQARGQSRNFRRGTKQSKPGVLQVTAEGKIEFKESTLGCAVRESVEELYSSQIGFALSAIISDPEKFTLYRGEEHGRPVTTYHHFLTEDIARELRLQSDSGGIVAMNEIELEGTALYRPETGQPDPALDRTKQWIMPEAYAAAKSLFHGIHLKFIFAPEVVNIG